MAEISNAPEMVCRRHDFLEQVLARLELSVQAGFATVNGTLKDVGKDLHDGAVEMATLRLRISLLEKVTYSAVGTALVAVLLAVLALVLKGGA